MSVTDHSPSAAPPNNWLANQPYLLLSLTAVFWAVKLLTTAFGESTSDYLVHNVNPYLAVVGGFVVFAVAMTIQLRVDRYVPWAYWLAVAMVASFVSP